MSVRWPSSQVFRAMTPLGWLAVMAAGVTVAAIVLGGLGFRWDPFDLNRRRLETANAAAAVAQAEAAARSAEAVGQAGQVARLDAVVRTQRSLGRVTSTAIQIARTADDTSLPLPDTRADRLRDHDRQLCRIAPDLVGCAAAPDPAALGDDAV